MTRKTRYVVLGATGALLVGLGGGLIAYLAYTRGAGIPPGLPAEVRYVPHNAEVVAFANVQEVMNSELRRQLMPTLDARSHKGQQMMSDFAGIDLEKQVHHLVAYVEPSATPDAPNRGAGAAGSIEGQRQPGFPRALIMVQGTFDQGRLEQFVRDHGGTIEEHNGTKMFVHRDVERGHEGAVALTGPNLIVMGQAELVRRAIDRVRGGAPGSNEDITDNAEMMNLIRDNAGSTAWVVGHFDAVRRRMRLPNEVSGQVPPLRFVSLKANVDGGVKATIRAEAGDEAAADQLRDVVRGFVSLARLQAGQKPGLESTLKSIELSGKDKTVQMSFAVAPDTLRQLAPQPPPAPPVAPQPPQAK
jgi:hypothetical protein